MHPKQSLQLTSQTKVFNEPVHIDEPYKTIIIEDGVTKTSWPEESNSIQTTHYTLLNFIPKCLFQQMIRPANFYFIGIAVLQMFRAVSTSQGVPTMCLPLSFVIGISMVKYAFEDYKRAVDDRKQNSKVYTRLRVKDDNDPALSMLSPGQGVISEVRGGDIKVGDIIMVHDGREMPADMLLIGRFQHQDDKTPKMFCHVATANIDGETSLKVKTVPEGLNKLTSEIIELRQVKARHSKASIAHMHREASTIFDHIDLKVSIRKPDGYLDEFRGAKLTVKEDGVESKYNIQFENFLHRGCSLANSGYIYGLVLFVGGECKIFKNAEETKNVNMKKSQVEDVMNSMIFLMGCIMICICSVLAICTAVWSGNLGRDAWYINFTQDPGTEGVLRFFTWMIIFCQFVPISMVVSVEMMRLCQSILMTFDKHMTRKVIVGSETKTVHCKAQQSALNEDLGMVEFVFSDKTGTLTENVLTFRQAFIPGLGRVGGGCTQIALMTSIKSGELDKLDFPVSALKASGRDQEALKQMVISIMLKTSVKQDDALDALMYADYDESVAVKAIKAQWEKTEFVWMTKATKKEIKDSFQRSIHERQMDTLQSFCVCDPPSPEENPDLYTEIFLSSLTMNNDVFPVIDDNHEVEYHASTPDDICMISFTKFVGMNLCPYIKPLRNVEYSTSSPSDHFVEQWEDLYLSKFNSAKARMSVVCKRRPLDGEKDDRVFIFVKGSDKSILSLADPKSKEYYHRHMEHVVGQFAAEGLRTLCVGFAVRSEGWWEKWSTRLKQQMSREKRDQLERELDEEVGYHICGATAVEDQLQEHVPETIEKLIGAGIRVWMLTGDKLETAINIGIACNLLSADSSNRVLMNRHNALDILRSFDSKKASNLQLVLDGGALVKIFDAQERHSIIAMDSNTEIPPEHDYLTKFIELALCAQSVVSCRMMPNQKAQIVHWIKQKTGLVTLAIGDGANDVPMIKTAGIGVGIQGLEGTAAARNSDYVIARFHHLSRLLFYHGRMAYRGTCFMILYLIWKNSQLGFVFVWFSFFSGFSGQNPMNEYLYQIYNTFPTGFPIFAFVLFDTDILPSFLDKFTHLYSITNGSKYKPRDLEFLEEQRKRRAKAVHFEGGGAFNINRVVAMIAESIVISLCISIPILACFAESTSWTEQGHSWGIMICGAMFWLSLVWNANVRLFLEYFVWTRWHYLSQGISLFSVPIVFMILNSSSMWSLSGVDFYTLVPYFLASSTWWIVLVLSMLGPLVPLLAFNLIQGLFFPEELFPYQLETKNIRQKQPLCADF